MLSRGSEGFLSRGMLALCLAACLVGALTGCVATRPRHVDNVCKIFSQYPKWYWYANETKKKWGAPVAVQMAIIHQESRFTADAKPPRQKLLWVIPWTRPSTAYGYAQAKTMTWKRYQRETGHRHSERDAFKAASDFVGWYGYQLRRRLGVPPDNVYAFYLAYHEGIGGYSRRTYFRKPWLIQVARKVAKRAQIYQAQLDGCRASLKRRPWWYIF